MTTTVYLCDSASQLLFVLCDVAAKDHPAVVHYLEDAAPLDQGLKDRLRIAFPKITLETSTDRGNQAQFENLPQFVPALIRRNRRWNGSGFDAPAAWHWPGRTTPQFAQGYIYNTGFFTAKVLAGRTDQVILREAGLNNYLQRPLTWRKRLARRIDGHHGAMQTMGDEPWISRIEVSAPHRLPGALQAKATAFDVLSQSRALDPAAKDRIIDVFFPDYPTVPDPTGSVVLLTQPLDLIDICGESEKIWIYQSLVDQLIAKGLTVYVKNHPRELPYPLTGTTALNHALPIELWHMTAPDLFHAGVALCSASLFQAHRSFCQTPVQLVDPLDFIPARFANWKDDLPARLTAALAALPR